MNQPIPATTRLTKGKSFNLVKGLRRVRVGIGWDATLAYGGATFDADVSVFALKPFEGSKKTLVSAEHFIFYEQRAAPDGSIIHRGDNRTGIGAGDDETVEINLDKLPAETVEVALVATIHQGAERDQDWGRLNALMNLYDETRNVRIASYDLGTDFRRQTAVHFGSLLKDAESGEWNFNAIGTGYRTGLEHFLEEWDN